MFYWCCCVILAACTVDAAQSMLSSAWYRGLGGSIQNSGIDINKQRAFGSDGASVMVGK